MTCRQFMLRSERRYWLILANRYGWNVSRMATHAGYRRSSVYDRLRALGIELPKDSRRYYYGTTRAEASAHP